MSETLNVARSVSEKTECFDCQHVFDSRSDGEEHAARYGHTVSHHIFEVIEGQE